MPSPGQAPPTRGGIDRLRRIARWLLTGLLAGSLAVAVWQGLALVQDWPASALVDRSAEAIRIRADAALARVATPAVVTARLDALLDATPRNWLAIDAVEEIAAARAIALPPDLLARRAVLYRADTNLRAQIDDCWSCLRDATTCDFSAILLCRVPVDLTVVGDLTGLVRAGRQYAQGEPIDEVDLMLSVVGLTAVAVVPFTGGNSASVKAGAGSAKLVWRSGRLAPELASVFRHAAREGLDWSRLGSVRSRANLAAITRPHALRPALGVLDDAGRMRAAGGWRRAFYLTAQATDASELRRLANAAEALGPRTTGTLELLGKSRLLRLTARRSNEVYATLLAGLAALAGLIGIAASAGTSLGLRLLRRLIREPRRARLG